MKKGPAERIPKERGVLCKKQGKRVRPAEISVGGMKNVREEKPV